MDEERLKEILLNELLKAKFDRRTRRAIKRRMKKNKSKNNAAMCKI